MELRQPTLVLSLTEFRLRQSEATKYVVFNQFNFGLSHNWLIIKAFFEKRPFVLPHEYCGPIDLMISDLVMPKMSGPNLAERLSPEHPRMKVLSSGDSVKIRIR